MEKTMKFIERLSLQSDLNLANEAAHQIIEDAGGWQQTGNQIGLIRRTETPPNKWTEGVGSLRDTTLTERDFQLWNIDSHNYIRQQVDRLKDHLNIETGRIRIMRLDSHRGLSVHSDKELRYHLVLKTNPRAHFGCYVGRDDLVLPQYSDESLFGINYHLPQDGYWYQVDTRRGHWVYNGGPDERIHIVVCGV
jgi:hypothetical protein